MIHPIRLHPYHVQPPETKPSHGLIEPNTPEAKAAIATVRERLAEPSGHSATHRKHGTKKEAT